MKILWVTAANEKSFGHTELYGLSKSLTKAGHDVTVVLGSKDKQGRRGDIQYVKNPFNRLLFFKLKLALYLARWAVSIKPDFIIVDWESAFVPIILLVLTKSHMYKNNLIHDLRTVPVPTNSNHAGRVFDLCLQISKRYYLGLTTITAALKDKLCSEYKIPPEKIGIWTSGVDLNRFYPRDGSMMRQKLGVDGKFVVFYHGSLGFRRGVVEVVEAIRLLNERYGDICLFILGSGIDLENIQRIKTEHNLHNVLIHPPVDYEAVPEYIAIADLCIVPLPDVECWRVSSPLKLMEYLAMGKPVLLTDIPAHREIVKNKEEAIFIPDIQPETLCGAIEKAYHTRKDLHVMGDAGLRNARENCSWDIQADRLIKFLEKSRIA